MEFQQIITQGCSTWNIVLPEQAPERLEQYNTLLLEKNKVMNLTAITQPEEMAVRHMLDCLFLLNCGEFKGKKAIDVGSGGGFPGIPLQIACPEAQFLLLDSRKKRVDFLKEVCQTMDLPAQTLAARAEEAIRQKGMREQFDLAVSRAVAPLNVLCELCLPFVRLGGRFLAMKSDNPAAELEIAQAQSAIQRLGGRLVEQKKYRLPGIDIAHQALVIQKEKSTPAAYPRRYAKIESDPL